MVECDEIDQDAFKGATAGKILVNELLTITTKGG
jgi:hypothetical protein